MLCAESSKSHCLKDTEVFVRRFLKTFSRHTVVGLLKNHWKSLLLKIHRTIQCSVVNLCNDIEEPLRYHWKSHEMSSKKHYWRVSKQPLKIHHWEPHKGVILKNCLSIIEIHHQCVICCTTERIVEKFIESWEEPSSCHPQWTAVNILRKKTNRKAIEESLIPLKTSWRIFCAPLEIHEAAIAEPHKEPSRSHWKQILESHSSGHERLIKIIRKPSDNHQRNIDKPLPESHWRILRCPWTAFRKRYRILEELLKSQYQRINDKPSDDHRWNVERLCEELLKNCWKAHDISLMNCHRRTIEEPLNEQRALEEALSVSLWRLEQSLTWWSPVKKLTRDFMQ